MTPTPAEMAEALYRLGCAPWEIGAAQPILRRLVALNAVRGRVLDPGCGTGHHSIMYAQAGCTVTGIDAAPSAIRRARKNARNAGVAVDFQHGNVTTVLDGYDEAQFDVVVDSKLYDNLEPSARRRYAAGLRHVLKPGGRLYLYGFASGTSVNAFHNHEPVEIDYENELLSAGFEITYSGPATYLLNSEHWLPICPRCPRQSPGDQMHIPIAEVHARAPKE